MKTTTDSNYKHDEKRDLTPEELVKAKTACEFVINLTKAISRSGYYDSNHPISGEVKRGLYDSFKDALGSSSEIMLTCHDSGEKTDIHISGILDEPVNIRKLTKADTSDLFVPKLKDYFERKSLNSFVIKKYITQAHFESFIDVMGEPIADSADSSKLGEYLTKALVDLDISEVSTVFRTDMVLPRGKLPWRVSIILRRLAKDMKTIPMFRLASADKIKLMKNQIIEDIIRPLNNADLLRDLIVNCDVIVSYLGHSLRLNEEGFVSVLRRRLMLDPFRDDNHLSSVNFHLSVVEVHYKRAFYDDECLICVRVAVPEEVASEFHDFELVVVHLGDHTHCIVASGQLSELVRNVDFLRCHSFASHNMPLQRARLFAIRCKGVVGPALALNSPAFSSDSSDW